MRSDHSKPVERVRSAIWCGPKLSGLVSHRRRRPGVRIRGGVVAAAAVLALVLDLL